MVWWNKAEYNWTNRLGISIILYLAKIEQKSAISNLTHPVLM